jgi:hypothetical protein
MRIIHLRPFVGIFLALAAAALACSAPATPTPESPKKLNIGDSVLKDDFATNNLGWDTYAGDEGTLGIVEGRYQIHVKTQYTEIWATPSETNPFDLPTDVILEVQAESTASEDNYFGLICRYQDIGNFYFLVVSRDGYYGIGKVVKGEQSLVNRREMVPTEVFKESSILNLRAECTGTRLALFVDDTLLDEQEDATFISGYVGLIAGSYSEPVTVFFDNFEVFKYKP